MTFSFLSGFYILKIVTIIAKESIKSMGSSLLDKGSIFREDAITKLCGAIPFITHCIHHTVFRMRNQKKRPLHPVHAMVFCPMNYFAYSMALVSRMTTTLTWPGYCSSFSTRAAISWDRTVDWSSLIFSGFTITRSSLPA